MRVLQVSYSDKSVKVFNGQGKVIKTRLNNYTSNVKVEVFDHLTNSKKLVSDFTNVFIHKGKTCVYNEFTCIRGIDNVIHPISSIHLDEWVYTRHGWKPGTSQEIINKGYGEELEYTYAKAIKGYAKELWEQVTNYIPNYSPQGFNAILKGLSSVSKDYTLGIEYETAEGYIPYIILAKAGLIPLRDGSIGGVEYVSTPIKLDYNGLSFLKNQFKKLQSFTKVDNKGSQHIRLSNPSWNKEFIVSMYLLWSRLESEILDLLPYGVRDPVNVLGKRQNYAERMLSLGIEAPVFHTKTDYDQFIDNAYNTICINFLGADLFEHKEKNQGKVSWNVSWNAISKHVSLNMLDFFTQENGGIEFRLHPTTESFTLCMHWLVLCISIAEYAKDRMPDVFLSVRNRQKIDLTDVIQHMKNKIGNDKKVKPIFESLEIYIHHYKVKHSLQITEAARYAGSNGGGRSAKFDYLKSKYLDRDKNIPEELINF